MSEQIWRTKRLTNYLEPRQDFYIFCEGTKTEPLYFEVFKDLIEAEAIYKNAIHIEPCGAETLTVLNRAKKYIKEHQISSGQIWCVYDKDDFPKDRFNQVVINVKELNLEAKTVNGLRYHAAWSNECIEFWFLLYFNYCDVNNGRDAYIVKLNEIFKNFRNKPKSKKDACFKYEKNNKQVFITLRNEGDEEKAIKFAKKIMKNHKEKQPADIAPGTKVYELVEALRKYLPKKNY